MSMSYVFYRTRWPFAVLSTMFWNVQIKIKGKSQISVWIIITEHCCHIRQSTVAFILPSIMIRLSLAIRQVLTSNSDLSVIARNLSFFRFPSIVYNLMVTQAKRNTVALRNIFRIRHMDEINSTYTWVSYFGRSIN